MPSHVKTYQKRTRLQMNKSTKSVEAINALFAENLTKRLKSRRKAKVKLKELPPRTQAYLTDDSLHVEPNDTFDKLKKGEVFNEVNICNFVKIQSDQSSKSVSFHSSIMTRSRKKSSVVLTEMSTLDKPVTSSLSIETECHKANFSSLSYIKLPKITENEVSNGPFFSNTFKERQLIHSSTPYVGAHDEKLVADTLSPITKSDSSNSSKLFEKSYDQIRQWDEIFPNLDTPKKGQKTLKRPEGKRISSATSDWKLTNSPHVYLRKLSEENFRGWGTDEQESSNETAEKMMLSLSPHLPQDFRGFDKIDLDESFNHRDAFNDILRGQTNSKGVILPRKSQNPIVLLTPPKRSKRLNKNDAGRSPVVHTMTHTARQGYKRRGKVTPKRRPPPTKTLRSGKVTGFDRGPGKVTVTVRSAGQVPGKTARDGQESGKMTTKSPGVAQRASVRYSKGSSAGKVTKRPSQYAGKVTHESGKVTVVLRSAGKEASAAAQDPGKVTQKTYPGKVTRESPRMANRSKRVTPTGRKSGRVTKRGRRPVLRSAKSSRDFVTTRRGRRQYDLGTKSIRDVTDDILSEKEMSYSNSDRSSRISYSTEELQREREVNIPDKSWRGGASIVVDLTDFENFVDSYYGNDSRSTGDSAVVPGNADARVRNEAEERKDGAARVRSVSEKRKGGVVVPGNAAETNENVSIVSIGSTQNVTEDGANSMKARIVGHRHSLISPKSQPSVSVGSSTPKIRILSDITLGPLLSDVQHDHSYCSPRPPSLQQQSPFLKQRLSCQSQSPFLKQQRSSCQQQSPFLKQRSSCQQSSPFLKQQRSSCQQQSPFFKQQRPGCHQQSPSLKQQRPSCQQQSPASVSFDRDLQLSDIIESSYQETDRIVLKTNANRQPKPKPKVINLKAGKSYRRSLSLLRRSSILVDASAKACPEDCVCLRCIFKEKLTGRSRRSSVIVPAAAPPNGSLLEEYARYVQEEGQLQQQQLLIEKSLDESVRKLSINVKKAKSEVIQVTARDLVLRRCGQTDVLPFEECYPTSALQNCHKIGEGVYGEVFLYKNQAGGTSVMKIIPIEGDLIVNGERQKKFDEILSEIVIAMELSNLRTNRKNATSCFSEVQKIRCTKGNYPDRLLDLWELYDETKGSENESPQMFPSNQMYIILELANGGKDLEGYIFQNAKQAYSILKQTASALAVAESELKFEHRDLHWGNVLISTVDKNKTLYYRLEGQEIEVETDGVEACVIDFTLSRMEFDGVVIFNDLSLDSELFVAKGDYQFEIYRLMQKSNGNEWQHFEPYTNILWLHYLLDKVTHLRYKNVRTKVHREYLAKLNKIKEEVLSYNSVSEFVKNNFL